MDVGVPVGVHDLTGDGLGIAQVPPPVELGDIVMLEDAEYRVVDVVETGRPFPVAARVKVRPVRLPVAAR